MTVAGLGDPSLRPGSGPRSTRWAPSPGRRRWSGRSSRCQSPISTASPNAVSVADAAQAAQPGHHRGEALNRRPSRRSRYRGARGDPRWPASCRRRCRRPAASRGLSKRCSRSHSSCFLSRPSRRSRRSLGAAAVSTTGAAHVIKSPRQSSRARTKSRAASCSTLGIVTAAISPRCNNRARCAGIAGIGLDPITRRALQLRRRRHHTIDPGRQQKPSQPEPGRAGLIDHRRRRRQRLDPFEDSSRCPGVNRRSKTSPVCPVQPAPDH